MHRNATFPVLLITAGLLWFLHSTALLPNAHSLVAIGLAVAGAADMVSGVFRGTIWNETIPNTLRGRLAGERREQVGRRHGQISWPGPPASFTALSTRISSW